MAYTADTLAYDVISEMGPRELKGPVWMLGRKYNLPKDKEALNDDVRSRIWCTYRRGFRPISGTHLSSDTGWGCTLRCGQMLLAQALLCKKFGREYRWTSGYSDPPYFEILRKFLDTRDSEYSLQMIALQGADFGRQVGQWFGPNNVAQAIRKLAAYDSQSRLAVHVAMDMLVVIDDLKALAREPHSLPSSPVNVENEKGEHLSGDKSALKRSRTDDNILTQAPSSTDELRPYSSSLDTGSIHLPTDTGPSAPTRGGVAANPVPAPTPGGVSANPDPTTAAMSSLFNEKPMAIVAKTEASSAGVSHFSPEHRAKELVMGNESLDYMRLSFRDMSSHAASPGGTSVQPTPAARVPSGGGGSGGGGARAGEEVDGGSKAEGGGGGGGFRSILLFIPLRLGQDTFNASYSDSLKACLTLPQSVGFIGGRPRHALYFIGYNYNELLFLDPHTTQNTIQMKEVKEKGNFPDSSYHTSNFGRMNISGLDPSIALGFFCKDENDLDDLVRRLRKVVLRDNCLNMFELAEHRPAYWGPFEPNCVHTSIREPFILVNREQDTPVDNDDDDGFEIIDWPQSLSPAHVQGPALVSTPRYRTTSPSASGQKRDTSLSDFSGLNNVLIN